MFSTSSGYRRTARCQWASRLARSLARWFVVALDGDVLRSLDRIQLAVPVCFDDVDRDGNGNDNANNIHHHHHRGDGDNDDDIEAPVRDSDGPSRGESRRLNYISTLLALRHFSSRKSEDELAVSRTGIRDGIRDCARSVISCGRPFAS